MDNSTILAIPHTSIDDRQRDFFLNVIKEGKALGINFVTTNSNMKPIDFVALYTTVCDPETVCHDECQNLENCQLKQDDTSSV